ncbi:thioredoxin family protein [Cytophagaceae bacterium ABcell3]|nr:thioredoxin family protein [Cytophagaceae bacterium ABcell3]
MRSILLILAPVLIILSAFKSDQPDYKPGDKVHNFTLLNSIDNTHVSLFDFSDKKGIVIIFTSHSCPYNKIYEERILKLANEFNDKDIQFLLINPNDPSVSNEDAPNLMAQWAQEKEYPIPYLIDSDQKVCNQFGATKTPEVFVMKNINDNLILFYKGAIDNNPQVATQASQHFLRDALNCLVNNKVVKISDKKAVGCIVKKL